MRLGTRRLGMGVAWWLVVGGCSFQESVPQPVEKRVMFERGTTLPHASPAILKDHMSETRTGSALMAPAPFTFFALLVGTPKPPPSTPEPSKIDVLAEVAWARANVPEMKHYALAPERTALPKWVEAGVWVKTPRGCREVKLKEGLGTFTPCRPRKRWQRGCELQVGGILTVRCSASERGRGHSVSPILRRAVAMRGALQRVTPEDCHLRSGRRSQGCVWAL